MSYTLILQRMIIGLWLFFCSFILIIYGSSVDGIREISDSDRLGRDFINFWTSGFSFWDADAPNLYDLDAYRSYLVGIFGEPLNKYNFSYPPHAVFLTALFGVFTYVPALILWSVGGTAAILKTVKSFDLAVPIQWFFLTPAVILCLLLGQTGLWVASLFLGGLLLSPKRPILAGALIGLLTIKPQFGPLLVLALLMSKQWKTIISASVTAVVLFVLSILFFGLDSWSVFLGETLPHQAKIISSDYGVFDYMVPSPFKWLINLDASITIAWSVQAVWMLLSSVGTIILFKSKEAWSFKVAGLGVLTFLFSPYVAVYDMALLLPAAFLVFRANPLLGLGVLSLPVIGMFTSYYDVPLSQAAILVLAGYFVIKPEKLRMPAITNSAQIA